MRVRKIAKQLKRHYKSLTGWDESGMPIHTYNMRQFANGVHYIMRMTRSNYFGLLRRKNNPQIMMNLYIHKANSPYLFDEIMEFWGCPLY